VPYTLTEWQPIVFTGRVATLPGGTPADFMLVDQNYTLKEIRDYTVSGSTVTLTYDPARPATGFVVGWTSP
jgi:hypothetical protein